jgi:hypothetical protein
MHAFQCKSQHCSNNAELGHAAHAVSATCHDISGGHWPGRRLDGERKVGCTVESQRCSGSGFGDELRILRVEAVNCKLHETG